MKRFEVWIVKFDPVQGSEIGKTRPGVIVSPDVSNDRLKTVLIAPLTSVRRRWPTRVPVRVNNIDGDAALDQLRAVDKRRLTKRIATLSLEESALMARRLAEMFKL